MNALALCLVVALAVVSAEPPSGYNYQRPSGGGGGGGHHGGGGFSSSGGGGSFSGGGAYIQESTGHSSSEGQHVDAQLLEKIRQIILREESQSGGNHLGGGGGGGGGGGYPSGPSSQYGPPSQSYGVPSHSSRVVGVDLEGVRQAIQVAQYRQTSHQAGGGGGYPAARPSSTYGANF